MNMTSRDFCFWLQGFLELQREPSPAMNVSQVETVRRHLALVFRHEIDPSMPDSDGKLQEIHDGGGVQPTVKFTDTRLRC